MMSYIDFLKNIYRLRKERNPGYSLVSFSRDAGFKSYHVHDVFSGRYGISPKRAISVAEKLKLSKEQSEQFVLMVTAENARNKLDRELAQKKLNQLYSVNEKNLEEFFSAMSEWYNLGLLGLISNPYVTQAPEEFAKRLGISLEQVQSSLTNLKEIGLILLDKNNKLHVKDEFFKIHSQSIPSQSIQNYHFGIIQRALESIKGCSTDQRQLKSMTLFLDPQTYKEFNLRLSDFTEKLIQEYIKKPMSSESLLYVLAHQTFPLETPPNA